MRNLKKYLTACIYGASMPLAVWDGMLLNAENYVGGLLLMGVLVTMEICAVLWWVEAQTTELVKATTACTHQKTSLDPLFTANPDAMQRWLEAARTTVKPTQQEE